MDPNSFATSRAAGDLVAQIAIIACGVVGLVALVVGEYLEMRRERRARARRAALERRLTAVVARPGADREHAEFLARRQRAGVVVPTTDRRARSVMRDAHLGAVER